ncbi:MAG: metallophosphoesterase [Nitrososphaerota archaeon]
MASSKFRIFFASDIHGSEICFRKFINAADFYKAQILILGGDITGKFLAPIFEKGGAYEASFMNEKHLFNSADELEKFMQKLRDQGFYPYITTAEEWDELCRDEGRMLSVFNEVMRESVERWIRLAESRLKGKSVKCYMMPGNDDSYAIDDVLSSSDVILNVNEKVIEVDEGVQMISLGYANMTPWRCPRDLQEEELEKKIDELVSMAEKGSDLIFNIHVPPYDSGIDSAPELDEHMRPKLGPGGQVMLAPVGSKAVRKAIEVYQPILSLHGHVHEARGFAKIGRSLCLNPGSEYLEGILRGVLVQVDNRKVRDFIFTSG